jgi:hypothetical protein
VALIWNSMSTVAKTEPAIPGIFSRLALGPPHTARQMTPAAHAIMLVCQLRSSSSSICLVLTWLSSQR